jgi:methylglyoxal synthase
MAAEAAIALVGHDRMKDEMIASPASLRAGGVA